MANSIEDQNTMYLNSVSEALVNYGSSRDEIVIQKEFEEIQKVSQVICPNKELGPI